MEIRCRINGTGEKHLWTRWLAREEEGREGRDTESGLDYFGARCYVSTMGRFTSSDPLSLEMHRLADL